MATPVQPTQMSVSRLADHEIVPLLIMIALLVLSAIFTPYMVSFRVFAATDVLRLLTSLFTIALFLERSLEVFVTTWRGPEAADIESQVKTAEQLIQMAQPGLSNKPAAEQLATLRKLQAQYKSKTQRYALWAGLGFGIVISAVGVRSLETFAMADALTKLPAVQLVAFRVVDVLLTGGLIAGGSEGIHKLTQVYTNFMDANAKLANARGNGPSAAPQPASAALPQPAAATPAQSVATIPPQP